MTANRTNGTVKGKGKDNGAKTPALDSWDAIESALAALESLSTDGTTTFKMMGRRYTLDGIATDRTDRGVAYQCEASESVAFKTDKPKNNGALQANRSGTFKGEALAPIVHAVLDIGEGLVKVKGVSEETSEDTQKNGTTVNA